MAELNKSINLPLKYIFGSGSGTQAPNLLPLDTYSNLVQPLLLVGAVAISLILGFGSRRLFVKDHNGKRRKIPLVKSIVPFISIPIIDSIYNLYLLRKHGVKFFEHRMKEYGNYYEMALGLNRTYCISDPTIIQKLITSNNPHHLNKAKEYRDIALKDFLEDALMAAEIDVWTPRKKILTRTFAYKSLHTYMDIMNRNLKEMCRDMLEAASSTGIIEGERLTELQFNTVKIIADIILGPGLFTPEENLTFLNTYKTGKDILIERIFNPLLLIKPIWSLHPQKKRLDSGMKFMRAFITKVTNKYREKRKLEQAQGIGFVDPSDDEIGTRHFRSMVEEMLNGGMNDVQIEDEVLAMMVTGHETTSIAINTLMFHLALHPEYQKMCRDESDNLIESKMLESDNDCELTMDDLNSLKYLERCILENLRLTPTLPIYIRRLDEPLKIDDDFQLHGGGKNVILLPWCLHRNPEHYPNPEKYDPDRFLPENVKARQAKHLYSYLPFSGGQRNCIGMKMAMMEMKMVMFWILRNFEIYTTDKMEDIIFRIDITLHPHKDINLILKKRNRIVVGEL